MIVNNETLLRVNHGISRTETLFNFKEVLMVFNMDSENAMLCIPDILSEQRFYIFPYFYFDLVVTLSRCHTLPVTCFIWNTYNSYFVYLLYSTLVC